MKRFVCRLKNRVFSIVWMVILIVVQASICYSQSKVDFAIINDTLHEGVSDKFYSAIDEEYLSIEYIDSNSINELVTIKDSIVLSFIFSNVDSTYEAIWKLKRNDRVIQTGNFGKDGRPIGEFYCFFPYDSAFCFFNEGEKSGTQYSQNWSIVSYESYKKGFKDGVSYILNRKGLSIVAEYKLGYMHGVWMQYKDDEIGKKYLYTKREYILNEVRDGKYRTYHPNGKVFEVFKYKQGKVVGKRKIFNEAGKLERRVEHKIK